jgi:hypothetical protein
VGLIFCKAIGDDRSVGNEVGAAQRQDKYDAWGAW